MTNEEKQLLLRDLCARLPYGTKVSYNGKDDVLRTLHFFDMTHIKEEYVDIKPYLRPLSSMTEEEFDGSPIFDCCQHSYKVDGTGFHFIQIGTFNINVLDYLNAHHFDYRGLIEKGLALEAPEGMYKED